VAFFRGLFGLLKILATLYSHTGNSTVCLCFSSVLEKTGLCLCIFICSAIIVENNLTYVYIFHNLFVVIYVILYCNFCKEFHLVDTKYKRTSVSANSACWNLTGAPKCLLGCLFKVIFVVWNLWKISLNNFPTTCLCVSSLDIPKLDFRVKQKSIIPPGLPLQVDSFYISHFFNDTLFEETILSSSFWASQCRFYN
jgi:hypothetical protein